MNAYIASSWEADDRQNMAGTGGRPGVDTDLSEVEAEDDLAFEKCLEDICAWSG